MGWRLVGLAPSYQRFLALVDRSLVAEARPTGCELNTPAVLMGARKLCGRAIDLIAVDMPLSRSPFSSRRPSDNAVSRAYGGRKCGTHSPNGQRPGPVSAAFTHDFGLAGYPLRTDSIAAPGLIEVYPHPALIELTGASRRLEYEAAKVSRYWRDMSPQARRVRLYDKWDEIAASLEGEMVGVKAALPRLEPSARRVDVKAHEDMLDAIVCAWVGVCALEGRARPYGDQASAIWIPNSKPVAA